MLGISNGLLAGAGLGFFILDLSTNHLKLHFNNNAANSEWRNRV